MVLSIINQTDTNYLIIYKIYTILIHSEERFFIFFNKTHEKYAQIDAYGLHG